MTVPWFRADLSQSSRNKNIPRGKEEVSEANKEAAASSINPHRPKTAKTKRKTAPSWRKAKAMGLVRRRDTEASADQAFQICIQRIPAIREGSKGGAMHFPEVQRVTKTESQTANIVSSTHPKEREAAERRVKA
jgi:hypothetical protein